VSNPPGGGRTIKIIVLNFAQFEWMSFDCYGTLIDWECGILTTLAPLLTKYAVELPEDLILEFFGRKETEIQQGSYLDYRAVLRKITRAFGAEWNFRPTQAELLCLEKSLPHWPVFPDTVASLQALKRRFKLAVLSNIDDDLFAQTAGGLGVAFDRVITAQQIGSYKPCLNNFRALLEGVSCDPKRLLHVGQSRYHDIAPARKLGLATVWVNRRRVGQGCGATLTTEVQPDLVVPDLQTLAAHCRTNRLRPAVAG